MPHKPYAATTCLFTFEQGFTNLYLMLKRNKAVAKKPKSKTRQRSSIVTFFTIGIALLLTGFSLSHHKTSQEFCANSISCIKDLTGAKEEATEGVFMRKRVVIADSPNTATFAINEAKNVLGDSTGSDKHIYVDLSNQILYAYDGNNLTYKFLVSTGKWNPTPTGDFRIWIWLRYTRMVGGNPAIGTYYNLPNVPYTMYFWNAATPKTWGYSLHGAYWHNNFGHPMSHGCINMQIEEAGKIFYWSNPNAGNMTYATSETQGPLITIYGVAPKE